ncbi:MAG: hypothetical protein KDK76_06780 [Chlamydiia bacterium]|nr:hypothetical protein [Chlamydiia bacterium]
MNDFEIIVASVPDRDELITELYYKGNQWVEISHETDEMVIQFYPHPSQSYWEFPLGEALQALERAKMRMISLGPKHPTPIDGRCVDIQKYAKCFQGGTLHSITRQKNSSSFTMESAFIDPSALKNKIILSKQNTLRGKLVVEEIESTSMLLENQTFENAVIKECKILDHIFELTFKVENSLDCQLKVCGKKIYWENFPTQTLEEIKTDSWKKMVQ